MNAYRINKPIYRTNRKTEARARGLEEEARKIRAKGPEYFADVGRTYMKAGQAWEADAEEDPQSLAFAQGSYKRARMYFKKGNSERESKDAEDNYERMTSKIDNYGNTRSSPSHSSKAFISRRGSLEDGFSGTSAVLSFGFFVLALTLSSFSITGFVIDESVNTPISYIALICFAVGTIFGVIFIIKSFKRRKNSPKKKPLKKKAKK